MVYDEEQEMLKKVWETKKQFPEERCTLETKDDSPHIKQTSFITLKTIDGDLSMKYE